jgi:hypothetical protein
VCIAIGFLCACAGAGGDGGGEGDKHGDGEAKERGDAVRLAGGAAGGAGVAMNPAAAMDVRLERMDSWGGDIAEGDRALEDGDGSQQLWEMEVSAILPSMVPNSEVRRHTMCDAL